MPSHAKLLNNMLLGVLVGIFSGSQGRVRDCGLRRTSAGDGLAVRWKGMSSKQEWLDEDPHPCFMISENEPHLGI